MKNLRTTVSASLLILCVTGASAQPASQIGEPAPEAADAGLVGDESLQASLESSLSRLSEAAQERIAVLGTFQGGATEMMILGVGGLEIDVWREIREELLQAGLVREESVPFPLRAVAAVAGSADDELPEVVPRPFYVFHPSLAPSLRARLSAEERTALEKQYREFYAAFAPILSQLDSGRPDEARALVRRELPNLLRALELTHNLANLLLFVHRLPPEDARRRDFEGRDLLAEAEDLAKEALQLQKAIDDPATQIWTTYNTFALIAAARDDATTAESWRRQGRQAYARFPGHWERHRSFWEEIVSAVAAATQADKEPREELRETLLAGFADNEDWRNLSAALGRVLDGERNAEALFAAHDLDVEDYVILTKVLEAIVELEGLQEEGGG